MYRDLIIGLDGAVVSGDDAVLPLARATPRTTAGGRPAREVDTDG